MKAPTVGFSIPLILAWGLILLAPAEVRSQEVRRLEVGGFIGGLSMDHDLGTASNLFFSVSGRAEGVDFGKFYGFRASFHFTRNLAAEGSLSRGANDFSFTVTDQELGTVSVGDQFTADQLAFGGNLVLQFPSESGLTPYGTVGVGSLRMKPQRPITGVETVSGTDFSLGGGVKYYLKRWAGLRFDIRYHLISDGLAFAGSSSSPRNTEFSIGGLLRLF